MRVTHDKDSGDAICLHKNLVLCKNADQPPPKLFQLAQQHKGFWKRLPKNWDQNYLDYWQARSGTNNKTDDVEDYAIIFGIHISAVIIAGKSISCWVVSLNVPRRLPGCLCPKTGPSFGTAMSRESLTTEISSF
jgi:hypothetical protein